MKFSCQSVTLSKIEARALLAHASKDLTHSRMSSVFFDARDLVAMATDGHRGVIAKGTGDVSEWRTLVPREALEAALVARVATLTITTDEEGLTGTIEALDKRGAQVKAESFTWPDGATFPSLKLNFRRAELNGTMAGLDARYLASLALVQSAAEETSDDDQRVICCPPESDDGYPFKFIVGAWTVIIMPCYIRARQESDASLMGRIRTAEEAIGPLRDNRPQKKAHAKAA